jgi:hypothetical protein
MALCCLYGFLLEGFTLFSLVGHLLIVMVTISSCIRCYGVVVYVSIHLLATVYLFTWSWSLFVLLASTQRLGGHYAKKYALGLLVVPGVCNSIDIVMCWFSS